MSDQLDNRTPDHDAPRGCLGALVIALVCWLVIGALVFVCVR